MFLRKREMEKALEDLEYRYKVVCKMHDDLWQRVHALERYHGLYFMPPSKTSAKYIQTKGGIDSYEI